VVQPKRNVLNKIKQINKIIESHKNIKKQSKGNQQHRPTDWSNIFVTLRLFLQQIITVRYGEQRTKLCTPVGVQVYARVA
jgi:hypothetical protein